MNEKKAGDLWPGLVWCLSAGAAAHVAGRALPLVGGALFGLAAGMALGCVLPRGAVGPGARLAARTVLQAAVVLLGFGMNLGDVVAAGLGSLGIMALSLAFAFVTAAAVSRALGMAPNQALLVAVGTSICGASAIAATAPVIRAGEEETGQALACIFLFNVAAVVLFPFLGRLMGMDDATFGQWAGMAINDTSSVVAAAASWSQASGNDTALDQGTVVKLARTLFIVPITMVLTLWAARRRDAGDAGGGKTGGFSPARVFPWFVPGFLAAAALGTYAPLPQGLGEGLGTAGKYLIVVAMVGTGFLTDPKGLWKRGRKSLVLGLACWAVVSATSLGLMKIATLRPGGA